MPSTQKRSQVVLWSAATLLCGLLVSALLAWQLERSNQARIRSEMAATAEQTSARVLERIRLYQYGLRGMRGAILTAGAELSRDLVIRYSRTRDVDREFPGARGFGFIRRVAQGDEARFLDQARADGWPAFATRQLAPHAGERFVIQYIEPVERNVAAVGLDIASERNRREAALGALRSGEVHLTGPITLVQATGSPQQSFLILMPIYRGGVVPATVAEREARGFGWSYAPLLIHEMLADLGLERATFGLQLQDNSDPEQPTLFYDNRPQAADAPGLYRMQLQHEVFGRHWQASFIALPAFVQSLHLPSPPLALALGALVSLLLAALAAVLTVNRLRRQQFHADQARLAAIVESSADGIIGNTLEGVVTSWNRGAEQLFGYSSEQAVGRRLLDLLVPADLQDEEQMLLEQVSHGERVPNFETRRLRSDGSLVDVSVTVSPIRNAEGRVTGASKTVRDITAQKVAEARIHEFNASLESQVVQRTEELNQLNLLLNSVLRSASEVAIIATDTQGTIRLFNAGAERMLGYRAHELLGKSSPERFHLSSELSTRGAQLSLEYGSPVEGFQVLTCKPQAEGAEVREWTYRCKDDTRLTVSVVVTAMYDDAGTLTGYLAIAIDISERKAAEQELAASLETTRAILDTAVNPIITIDDKGVVCSFNPAGERVFGYERNEVVGQNVRVLMPEPYRSEHDEHLEHYLHGDQARAIGVGREVLAQRKDGSIFPIQISLGAMQVSGQRMVVGIITDITAQQKQRSELMAARDQLLMAAEVAELGIWTWVLADNSLQWNDRMFELYGQPPSLQVSGLDYQHWRSRVHPDDVEAAEAKLLAAVDGHDNYDPIFRVVRPDGQIQHIQAGAQIERDAAGKALRVTGINRDITAQLQVETHLRQAKEQADAASAAKSSFLANMSHEIRTPMNAVLGMLQLVEQTELNLRQRDYVTKAQGAAKSLLGLLNDILDYSKIEAGKLQLDPHPFEPEKLMRDLGVVLSGSNGQKEVEVLFDLDPQLPDELLGDSLRLQQILINLAGNALKFTAIGQVVVSIGVQGKQADGVKVRIEVSDSGIGISHEQLQRIFDGFTQAEASTTRRFGGTGLGLVISKRLVGLMGGELQVESEPGAGSRFWFDILLPLTTTTRAKPPRSALHRPLRGLLVDDNSVALEILARSFAAFGWQADLASDGQQALEQVLAAHQAAQPYDVVMLDWNMPGVDGISTARMIRQALAGDQCPRLVILTAYGREVLAQEDPNDMPYDGFLSKPVTPQQLASAVRQVMNLEEPEPDVVAKVDRPQRLAGLRLLVVEDNALNRQVASELLASEGALVTLAEGGLEGVSRVLTADSPYDVVLMDVQMPDIDGLEATRRIRADSRFAQLPILAMTANASRSDRADCLAAGMNDHVGKPIDLDELVRPLLQLTGGAQPAMRPATPPAASSTGAIEDMDSIIARFGGNLGLFRDVLLSFRAEMGKILATLAAAIGEQDLAASAAALHTLKGSAGTLGASRLSARAGELEDQLKSTPADAALTLPGSVSLDELTVMVSSAAEAIEAALADVPAPLPPAPAAADLAWREQLETILPLLESGNLEALERVEALVVAPSATQSEYFDQLVIQARALDFTAAARSIRLLMANQQA
ncbi:PAS domain S-box protein [Pseudomonas sp. SA3-5]|uniref:histidine kinase n=1 Tax=Pseudomonas aestuarii TaxID=3018340 RepID=A0ABT4XKB3_9PSED|nr:PAS domain S-box protein [Pseudomonas aestuarii]MDA7088587.1 PAS domain S-box protein [Pseudomonas aestuarii]